MTLATTCSTLVLSYSELDNAKVGERVSKSPLHDTYIDRDCGLARGDIYAKSELSALVPEIDEPVAETGKNGQHLQLQQPLPRALRVFTTPIKYLPMEWKNTAKRLRSKPSHEETGEPWNRRPRQIMNSRIATI